MIICRDTAPAVSAKSTNKRENRHNYAGFPVLDTPEGCPYDSKLEGVSVRQSS